MMPELVVSKQKLRQAEGSCLVRIKREEKNQTLAFSSRPFVLCGLPVRRPPAGELLFERRTGSFVLQITGHRNLACRSDKTALCRSIWPLWRFSRKARRLASGAVPKCWRHLHAEGG